MVPEDQSNPESADSSEDPRKSEEEPSEEESSEEESSEEEESAEEETVAEEAEPGSEEEPPEEESTDAEAEPEEETSEEPETETAEQEGSEPEPEEEQPEELSEEAEPEPEGAAFETEEVTVESPSTQFGAEKDSSATVSSLDAAGEDANTNFSEGAVDQCVESCHADSAASDAIPASGPVPAPVPGPPVPPPPAPATIEVTVTDAKTGKAISGASVKIAGPESREGTTDGSGKVTFGGLKAGAYTVTASNNGYTTETSPGTGISSKTTKADVKLTPITVTITPAAAVGCPGHPMEITATGDPAGGTYAWSITGTDADLVDATGTAVRSGDKVNLRGFKTDTGSGDIQAITVTVAVTYTYTNGSTANADKRITIHEIKFVTTNKTITPGLTRANESAAGISLGNAPGVATMATDPKVEIRLDASCPRKSACAQNHRVGWLQTVLTNTRQGRYTHSSVDVTVPLPIRDVWNATVFPFYSTVTPFTADRDKQTAHHEDSPTQPFGWTDPRAGAPAPPPAVNQQLRRVAFSDSFTAWLVVENIEWAAHDLAGSFAFVGNFDWSMELNVTVDTSKAVGSRATPRQKKPTMPAQIAAGKGGGTPNLAAAFANTSATTTVTAAPGI